MKIAVALQHVTRLFLDTAPVIYFVEQNPNYQTIINAIFGYIAAGNLTVVTSSITLEECIKKPKEMGNQRLVQDFTDLIVNGQNTEFIVVNDTHKIDAATLQQAYNLPKPRNNLPFSNDTLQFAVALHADCHAFLTNDKMLRRVHALSVLVVEDLHV